MFLIQHNCIWFVLKHQHTNLALCSRGETSHWGIKFPLPCVLLRCWVSFRAHVNGFFCCCCYRCQHENLVELLGFSSDGAQPCLVYEYMPNGSLLDRLACLVSESFSSFQLPYFANIQESVEWLSSGTELWWPNDVLTAFFLSSNNKYSSNKILHKHFR